MDLWGFCAEETHERTDGDLTGMSDEDIADAACWDGDPTAFVPALVQCRLLEGLPGHRQIHDWAVHQPFVAGFLKRSAQASSASQQRWHAHRMRSVYGPHTDRNPPTDRSDRPTDTTDPIRPTRGSASQVRRADPAVPPSSDLERYIAERWPDLRMPSPEAAWREACPAVDLLAEARKAHAWEQEQPLAKRKRDHRAFLGRWFRRAQEDAAKRGGNGPAQPNPTWTPYREE